MILSFTLSMPSVASWNGKWSGDGKLYGLVKHLGRAKKDAEKAQAILEKGYFHYNFGDGWNASIVAKEIDAREAAKIRKRSAGFCGYGWMIESIIRDMTITPPSERRKRQE